jgi:hypothetical protein
LQDKLHSAANFSANVHKKYTSNLEVVPNLYPDALTEFPVLEELACGFYTIHESGYTK